MYEITIEDTFDAAHCLREYSGTCRNLHGHTYRVCARFRYTKLDESGIALDFRKAKQALRNVTDYLDHTYMNELPEFSVQNPTAENIARFIYCRLKETHPELASVSVWETATSCATYYEDDPRIAP
ncbi:MAG: 6-carboxytetrahydropterin synthase QueD [Armatimonadetes bacterium]|nr:6-carboxytetrahydropterin synthase QueD [Armatimonadota bacterium]